jgi:hypothetical protein
MKLFTKFIDKASNELTITYDGIIQIKSEGFEFPLAFKIEPADVDDLIFELQNVKTTNTPLVKKLLKDG